MSATLCIFEDAVLRSAKEHKDLIPSFVSILKVCFSFDFDFHCFFVA
jgi:hypothetical protein